MRRHPVDHVVVAAGKIAARRGLDLDYSRAEISQVPGADRRGDGLLDGNDEETLQRLQTRLAIQLAEFILYIIADLIRLQHLQNKR
jgi:hypothetical protein